MNIRKNIKQNLKLYMALFLVMALVVAVVKLPVSESYAYKVSKDPDSLTPAPLVTDLEDEYIKVLDDISIYNENVTDSELIMLEDIVERSYNNDFNIKSYIIKTKDRELDKTYYSSYLNSRGDVSLSARFDENSVVYDGKEYYYHSITANATPAFDKFDYETRKIEHWDEYIEAVREAEKEIGYIEIEDEEYKNNTLCDYQLINQTLAWMAKHMASGTCDGFSSQTAMSAVIGAKNLNEISNRNFSTWSYHGVDMDDRLNRNNAKDIWGAAACAGYARIFNRFMHDFGIDSYYATIPSWAHAMSFVRLGDEYYCADTDCAYSLFSHTNNHVFNSLGSLLYNFNSHLYDRLKLSLEVVEKNNMTEYEFFGDYNAIIHYNPYIENHKDDYYFADEPLRNWENTEYFDVEGSVDEHCTYCGKHHYFPLGGDTIIQNKEPLVKNSYFFKGSYRKFDYDIFNWVDVQEFHIYEGYYMDSVEHGVNIKRDICPEGVDTTTKPVTPIESTPAVTTTPADANTTSTSGEVESTGDSNNNTTTIADETTGGTIITTKTPVATTGTSVVTTKTPVTTVAIPNKLKPKAKNIKTKSIKLTWKRTKNAKMYQIQYSTNKKFKKSVKSKTVSSLKYTIKKLTKNKTYYVRIRGKNGKVYGKWSKIVRVKIKK